MDSVGWSTVSLHVDVSPERTHDLRPQTPATCANIALHNLYPGQIDLLVRDTPMQSY